MAAKLLVRVGVVGVAIAFASGCGAKQELRPQQRPDPSPGYDVLAVLPAKSGVGVGAEVILEGAKAGRVTHVEVDGSRLIATLRIRSRYAPLDVDTQAFVRRGPCAARRACVVLVLGHHGSPLADQRRLPSAP